MRCYEIWNTVWYEIWNTVSEIGSECTARWSTSELAINDMVNHCNWCSISGTGKIYKVVAVVLSNGSVELRRSLIHDFRHTWDGTSYNIVDVCK